MNNPFLFIWKQPMHPLNVVTLFIITFLVTYVRCNKHPTQHDPLFTHTWTCGFVPTRIADPDPWWIWHSQSDLLKFHHPLLCPQFICHLPFGSPRLWIGWEWRNFQTLKLVQEETGRIWPSGKPHKPREVLEKSSFMGGGYFFLGDCYSSCDCSMRRYVSPTRWSGHTPYIFLGSSRWNICTHILKKGGQWHRYTG